MSEKMCPAKVMAKAAYERELPNEPPSWDELEPWEQEILIEDMRAALRALAKCEPTEAMRNNSDEAYRIENRVTRKPLWHSFTGACRAYILAAAAEGVSP